jgi:hypothetical protein
MITAAIVLAVCLLLWKRSTLLKQRLGIFGSPLLESRAYRALLVLVLIGILLVSMLPEAAFVLPALDAVGLEIVTFLVALELRHYLATTLRFLGSSPNVCCGVLARAASRCVNVLRTSPVLWLYACMWPLIWLRTIKGTMAST